MKPITVTVNSSENPSFFQKDQVFDYDHFERMALQAALTNTVNKGLTFITVTFSEGDPLTLTLALNPQSQHPTFRCIAKVISIDMETIMKQAGETPTAESENAAHILKIVSAIEWEPATFREYKKNPAC